MTLQQLKYADAVARCGSVSEAAKQIFASQPSITESILNLEEELRTAIFVRSNRGMVLTREGEEFLASARRILEDAARIKEKYTGKAVRHPQFSVSCQHYAFAVEAFMEVVRACGAESYDFTLRETVTSEIIEDVSRRRSEIGVMYMSRRNERALGKILRKEMLRFEELFSAKPHVFLGKKHPLARKKTISPRDLDGYPYLSYEQGSDNALYYAEEVMASIDRKKNIRVRDRATMTNLVLGLDGFTVASGVYAKAYNSSIVSVPLKMDDDIRVGFVMCEGLPLSHAGGLFVKAVHKCLEKNVRQ